MSSWLGPLRGLRRRRGGRLWRRSWRRRRGRWWRRWRGRGGWRRRRGRRGRRCRGRCGWCSRRRCRWRRRGNRRGRGCGRCRDPAGVGWCGRWWRGGCGRRRSWRGRRGRRRLRGRWARRRARGIARAGLRRRRRRRRCVGVGRGRSRRGISAARRTRIGHGRGERRGTPRLRSGRSDGTVGCGGVAGSGGGIDQDPRAGGRVPAPTVLLDRLVCGGARVVGRGPGCAGSLLRGGGDAGPQRDEYSDGARGGGEAGEEEAAATGGWLSHRGHLCLRRRPHGGVVAASASRLELWGSGLPRRLREAPSERLLGQSLVRTSVA